MDRLRDDWVNRIFERLSVIYKERWQEWIGPPEKEKIAKIMWSSGLAGLTAEEIRKALTMLEFSMQKMPPTVVEFYHIAKGHKILARATDEIPPIINKERAKHYLSEIKSKLKPCSI